MRTGPTVAVTMAGSRFQIFVCKERPLHADQDDYAAEREEIACAKEIEDALAGRNR